MNIIYEDYFLGKFTENIYTELELFNFIEYLKFITNNELDIDNFTCYEYEKRNKLYTGQYSMTKPELIEVDKSEMLKYYI